jgi:hypothetical protein
MPIGCKKVFSTNSGYKYKLLHRLGRLMIVGFCAFAGPRGNEISSICTLTFRESRRARQIIIILLIFFRLFLFLYSSFANIFHIKSHRFQNDVHFYLWKRRRSSCNVSHSILFLESVVVAFIAADKKSDV